MKKHALDGQNLLELMHIFHMIDSAGSAENINCKYIFLICLLVPIFYFPSHHNAAQFNDKKLLIIRQNHFELVQKLYNF